MKIDYPITFLYYKDLASAIPFYADVMGLELFVDQGWCKIFKINDRSCVGLVDETRGSLRATDDKAVLLTFVVDDVEEWHQHLTARKIDAVTPVKTHESIGVKAFTCRDPGGYLIEVQRFL